MIEIVPDKPEITDELAMSALKVVQDYARGRKCDKCILEQVCDAQFEDCPEHWKL